MKSKTGPVYWKSLFLATTLNQYSRLYGIRNGMVEQCWFIEGRAEVM